jgi:MHS family proline/betaine transporter-like MFS transporter
VVISFILTFLQKVVGVEPIPAYLTVVAATLFGAALIPVFGWLSDKYGRKPVLVAACFASMVLPIVGFFVVITGSLAAVMIGQLLMWIPVSIFAGVTPAAYAEMFPTEVRVSGFGIAYSIATAIFSGTAPFVATLLVQVTGSAVAPGWYITLAGLISLFFVCRLRETSREDLPSNAQSEAVGSSTTGPNAASGPADPKVIVAEA